MAASCSSSMGRGRGEMRRQGTSHTGPPSEPSPSSRSAQHPVSSLSGPLKVQTARCPLSWDRVISLPRQNCGQAAKCPVSSVSDQLNVQTTHDAVSSPSSLLSVPPAVIFSHLIIWGCLWDRYVCSLCCSRLQEFGLWHRLQSVPCGQACRGQKE